MIYALLLAAVVEQCNSGNTYDMRACWSRQDSAANDALQLAHRRLTAEMEKLGIDRKPLEAATAAWMKARAATCAFEYRLYASGTIAPQLQTACDVRMTQARTKRLNALAATLAAHRALPAETPVSAAADRELNRVYGLYRSQIDAEQRKALSAAELAWIEYRDTACAIEGGSCLTELERERVAELEASWLGEAFW